MLYIHVNEKHLNHLNKKKIFYYFNFLKIQFNFDFLMRIKSMCNFDDFFEILTYH